jgi:hypothetical protein
MLHFKFLVVPCNVVGGFFETCRPSSSGHLKTSQGPAGRAREIICYSFVFGVKLAYCTLERWTDLPTYRQTEVAVVNDDRVDECPPFIERRTPDQMTHIQRYSPIAPGLRHNCIGRASDRRVGGGGGGGGRGGGKVGGDCVL